MSDKKKVYLTEQGYENLKKELDDLINVKRPANINAIKEARALGDLSENADYDAARAEQAEIEGRIKQIEKMIIDICIIDFLILIFLFSVISNTSSIIFTSFLNDYI